ncbi:MAG: alpha/beta fold hydrolase [Hymenobacter sp.]|nr:MAG: alpha/beta fold hydrolase [Hymenobacter sp.]
MKVLFAALLLLCCTPWPPALAQAYQPRLELAACPVKYDARLVVKYGYLVVPENRRLPQRRSIKIPFLFVRRPTQDARRLVSLFSTGGPGYSTTANLDSIGYQSGLLKYGGVVLFDQRGTRRAQPCLDCPAVDEAIRRSYRTGLNKDSLALAAVRNCRQRLSRQGIDLSAYTTLESAEDINDLRRALHLDSLNLIGISYSGGLMLTVARTHPEAVRSLVLNSPLPGYTRYEEEGLLNINEALEQALARGEADSVAHPAYRQLRNRFRAYFTALTGKKFALRYLEKGTRDSLQLTYTKNELLDAVVSRLTTDQVATVPLVVSDLLQGRHAAYVREQVDAAFAGDPALALGMRYSVYCTEQLAYARPAVEKRQGQVLPWLAGYPFNNVTHALCSCWNVQPAPLAVKVPIYSAVPALLAAGDIDPWCRPFYNQLIKRYLPNSQLLTWQNQGHAPGFATQEVDYLQLFLAHPYQPLRVAAPGLRLE